MFKEDGGVGTMSSSRTRRSRARRAGAVRTTAFLGFAERFRAGARFFVTLARADRATTLRRPAGFRDRFAFLFFARARFRLAMLMSFRNLDSVAISVVRSDAYRNSGTAVRVRSAFGAIPGNLRCAGSRTKTLANLIDPTQIHGVVE